MAFADKSIRCSAFTLHSICLHHTFAGCWQLMETKHNEFNFCIGSCSGLLWRLPPAAACRICIRPNTVSHPARRAEPGCDELLRWFFGWPGLGLANHTSPFGCQEDGGRKWQRERSEEHTSELQS